MKELAMRICAVFLMLCLLVGCATTTPTPPPPRLFMPAGEAVPATPPPEPGPSAGQIIGTILLLPLLIPLAAIASSPYGYAGGYSCKGKVYADGTKWKTSCY
jgi:hypothetical protein